MVLGLVQEAHHPIDTDTVPTLARLNSSHRRRRSASGSGAVVDMGRGEGEAGGGQPLEANPYSSRGFVHK